VLTDPEASKTSSLPNPVIRQKCPIRKFVSSYSYFIPFSAIISFWFDIIFSLVLLSVVVVFGCFSSSVWCCCCCLNGQQHHEQKKRVRTHANELIILIPMK
jgi:hypothetical protein